MQVGSYNTQVNYFSAPAPASQVVTGAIPAQPPSFQSRAALMDALAEGVGSDRVAVVCALTGQRGVGKTQLAAAYARRRVEQQCPVVAWVNAERPESILAGLEALASALGLRREGEDAVRGVARLLGELQTRIEPALVVFDNVTDPDDVAGYLPATGATQIILTSTQQSVRNLGQSVSVEVYTPAEAVGFLREASGLDDEVGAGALAAELGWLPLALAHAAGVIGARGITYSECGRLIRDYPLPRYLIHQPVQHYPHGSAETILLSLHDVGFDTNPELARLAGVLALLSPNGIPRALLTALTNGDATVVDDRIACLAGGSIITHTADRTALRMHRLVARVIRDWHRAKDGYPDLISTTVAILARAVFPAALAWQRRQDGNELIAQIDTLWEHSDLTTQRPSPSLPDDVVERLMSLRSWSVRQLTGSTNLDRAIALARIVHIDCQRLLGQDHPHTLGAAHNLADAYQTVGRLDQAIPLFEQTLTDRQRLLSLEHLDTLCSANSLAYAYQAAGQLEQAIPLHEQTLGDCRRLLGDDHPDTLTSANNLAYTYKEAGRLDQAIPLFERTLTDCRRLLGDDHPDSLRSAHNLAGAYQAAGRLDQAIPLHEQTLTNCRRLLGDDHPKTLTSAHSLASAYESAGRLDQAIPLCERTLTDRLRLLGPEHPDTLTSANNLAGAYESAGRLDQSIPLYEQALTDCRRLLGQDHPLTQTVAANLQRTRITTDRPLRRRWWRSRAN